MAQIFNEDARRIADLLEPESVQCVVTSPPYFGLRDYGVDGQIGLEGDIDTYIEALLEVFRGVWKALRSDGTLWLNLGDSYAGAGAGGGGNKKGNERGQHDAFVGKGVRGKVPEGLKPKDLMGIPWRVAFALQEDGWYLRSDIIWSKPNPMPESVADRPTKAHEYIFLLTKSPRYYYDAEAIVEPAAAGYRGSSFTTGKTAATKPNVGKKPRIERPTRNRRSVWTIATQPYPEAHFATFPEKLPELCILAGSSPKACPKCGAPWERVTSVEYDNPGNRTTNGPRSVERRHESPGFEVRLEKRVTTTGWNPTCTCDGNDGSGKCIVLDPFAGSGTTLAVAERLQRQAIGFELNPEYVTLIEKRLSGLQLQMTF